MKWSKLDVQITLEQLHLLFFRNVLLSTEGWLTYREINLASYNIYNLIGLKSFSRLRLGLSSWEIPYLS